MQHTPTKQRCLGLILAIFCFNFFVTLQAQDNPTTPDTLKIISIDEVVITANRYENKLLNTGASIEVMHKKEIHTLPVTGLSNALKYLPGIYLSSSDGMGLNPQISLRGFYGGGEAEYVTVLVDGVPVNDVENGLVSWNLVPLNQIDRVELLRGGSSSLYGNAAMGGVMNIITDKASKPFTNASVNYGSYNSYGIGITRGGNLGKGKYEFFANDDHTDGFREHSNWNSVTFGGKLKFPIGTRSSISFSSNNQILESEDPGVIDSTAMQIDRKQSLPYFREDGRDQKRYLANANFKTKVNKATDLSVGLNYQYKKKDDVRTYTQPTPIVNQFFVPYDYYDTTLYGDTKRRQLTTNQAGLNLRILNVNTDIDAKIAGGIEVNYGAYDNDIYDVYHGFENDYQNNYSPIDTLAASGMGYRFNSAVYLNGEFKLLDPLKLIVGLRYDLIVDDFDSSIPDTAYSENNSALSPKIAFNINTGETDRYSGSIYLSYSRSFKAPTIDQQTDYMRLSDAIFFKAGPAYQMVIYQAEPFANPALKPQKSNNYEIGTYQYYKFSDKISSEINLVGYLIEVKDEIDFDLSTLNYQNLTSTSHTGMEISIKVMSEDYWNAFTNINYNETKFTSGKFDSNYLNGLPKISYVFGAGYNPPQGFGGTLIFNGAGKQYLDDENLVELNGYGILSARIGYKLNFMSIYIDANNIFNSSYSTAGYFMNGQKYLYPAMGIFFRGGLNFSF